MRRVSLFLFAALSLLAACDAEPSTVGPAPPPKPARLHNGYFLQMPLQAVAPGIGSFGGAIINVTSNLPDGTIAYVTSTISGQEEQIHLLHTFVAGTLRMHPTRYCVEETNINPARGFDIHVVVVPDISLIFKGSQACRSLTECGRGPLQPRSVQAILGRNFERLTGDEVTTLLGTRAFAASAHYAWPKDACRKQLELASGAPRICPPSSATINEDEGGANVEAVAESIAILFRQNRVCDLYNFTTARFQRTTSWSEFRDRILRWRKRPTLYAMSRGGFRKKGPETIGVLKSPAFIEAGYHIWGKTAGYATFVARSSSSGETKWEIARLEFV